MQDLYRLTATQAVALLRKGEVTPLELVEASIARIGAVDGVVNALPIHCFERARDQAKKLRPTRTDDPRYLHGLPIAVKDYNDVGGVLTPVRVVEERRTRAGLRHLAHGAAEVEVDEVGPGGLDHPRRLGHRRRV